MSDRGVPSFRVEPVAITDLSSVLDGHATLTQMLQAALPAASVLADGRSVLESGSIPEVHAVLAAADDVLDALLRYRIAQLGDGVRTGARLRVTEKARGVADVLDAAYDEHLVHVGELTPSRRRALRASGDLARWHVHLGTQGVRDVAPGEVRALRSLEAAQSAHRVDPSPASTARLLRASARVEAFAAQGGQWHAPHAEANGLRPAVVTEVASATLEVAVPVWEAVFSRVESGDQSAGVVSWGEAVDAVLDGFASVDPAAAASAERALASGWVDALDRPGRSEVFCTWHAPRGGHPVSLVSWEGSPAGLYLLAHELGHVAHQELMARRVHSLGPQYLASEFVATFLAQAALDAWADRGPSQRLLAALPPLDTWVLSALEHRFELAVHQLAADGRCTPRRLDAAWADLAEGRPGLARGFDSWTSVRVALSWPGMVHTYALATPAAVLAASGDRSAVWQAAEQAHELGALGLLAAAGVDASSVSGVRRLASDAAVVLASRAVPDLLVAPTRPVRPVRLPARGSSVGRGR